MKAITKRRIVIGTVVSLALFLAAVVWSAGALRTFDNDLEEIANGYFYFIDKRMIAQNPRNDAAIPSYVVTFEVSGDFVLASRLPSKSSASDVRYWILDTKRHEVRRDLSADQFAEEAQRRSIPKRLVTGVVERSEKR